MKNTVRVSFGLGFLLTVLGCTAQQRGWWHDHVPLVGSLFQPFVPVPPPLWQSILGFVANLFVDHPAEAVPATVAAVGAAAHYAGQVPGTERRRRRLEKVAARRAADRHVDAKLAHFDARKAAARAKAKADKLAAVEAAKAAHAAATPPVLPLRDPGDPGPTPTS